MRRPVERNGGHGYLLPDDGTYHDDKRLIADLADLNTQVGRYVLEHLSADAGNSAPIRLGDEHRLGIELVRVGVRVIERADRRRRAADEQRPTNVDRQDPT